MTLGSDPECDIVLASSEVSGRHAQIWVQNTALLVTDTSDFGTFVGNGRRKILGSTATIAMDAPIGIGPFVLTMRPLPPSHTFDHAASRQGVLETSAPGPLASARPEYSAARALLRRRIHKKMIEELDLARMERERIDPVAMRPRVREALARIIRANQAELSDELSRDLDVQTLIDELTNEALGLGPLEAFLHDDSVSEIMVVDAETIFVERAGKIERVAQRFTDDTSLRAVIERVVTPVGRRIDESTPMVDTRLPGMRVNAIIPPLALRGPCITIRKFSSRVLGMDDLVRFGTLDAAMARFLVRCVRARKNLIVSGGTGSGKTTLLNILSSVIPEAERVVTIEDAAELSLQQAHVVTLEARPPNMEGRGEVTIRDLVRNALRMRPDRIVVGECRGGETLDMLQAMNTGHQGSMTTVHANTPDDAVSRLGTLTLMAGLDLPVRAIREQLASSIDVIVQQHRFSDGTRRITDIAEVTGMDDEGRVQLHSIYEFTRSGTGPAGEVLGEFAATGYLPAFLDEFIALGLTNEGGYI